MTEHFRSSSEIEREIEEDRARLSHNLSHLQDKFSVESFVNSAGDQIREHGGDFTRALSRTVKENPAAVALTGVGLAWMIFGKQRRSNDDARFEAYRDPGNYHRRGVPVSRPTAAMVGDNIGAPAWARDEDSSDSYTDIAKGKAADLRDSANAAGRSAAQSVSDLHAQAREKATQAKDAASYYANELAERTQSYSDGSGGMMSDWKERAAARTESFKRQLSEGTDTLSAEARTRIIEARYAALRAKQRASSQMRRATDGATDLYERQPLVAGALAIAVGAAIAGALPRTRVEDDNLGAQSDALIERAERIFAEERAKAMEVAQSAKSEAQKAVKSVGADLKMDATDELDKVAERARNAAKNVKDATVAKAEETGLGKPKV